MRKCIFITAVLLILFMGVPAFAQWELGMSATVAVEKEEDQSGYAGDDQGAFEKILPGFHFGYRWFGILYACWDSIVMPPEFITDMTGMVVKEGELEYWKPGPYRPGFLNLWDIGAKVILGPFVAHTEVGINSIYVYRQAELPDDFSKNFGANWRAGIGLKFGSWGVNADYTAIFPSFNTMMDDIGTLIRGTGAAQQAVKDKIKWIPSLTLIWYL